MRGTLAELNAALDGLTFTPTADYNGSATLTVTTNDLGNTGNGGPMIDTDSIAITVDPTNDDPAVELGTAMGSTLTVNATEDTDFTFSTAASNQIVISDRTDDPTFTGTGQYDVALSIAGAMPGALTLFSTTGLDFGQTGGDSDGSDGSLRFRGTLADVNAALDGMVYSPVAGVSDTSRTLAISVNDLGNIDSDLMPELTGSGTVTIVIDGSNDAPVNTLPVAGALTTTMEDTGLIFSTGNSNAISIFDIDANLGSVQVSLTATNGALLLNGAAGLDFSFNDGLGTGDDVGTDGTLVFRGQQGAINTALNGLTFTPAQDFNGSASLTVSTNDLGNTGVVFNPLTDTDSVGITVTAVNDAPAIARPASISVNEDLSVTISAANMNGVRIDDVDLGSGKFLVTLSVGHGILTLKRTTGLTFSAGGTGQSTMSFTGSRTAVNAALDGMIYTPAPGYNGADTLSLSVDDQGNTGTGGPLSDSAAIPITVGAVNDAPVLTLADQTVSVDEGTLLTFSTSNLNQISITDIDVLESPGNGRVQVKLSVMSGTLSLSTLNNITIDAGANSSSSVTFSGPIGNVNAALSGLGYQPANGFNGLDALDVTVSDLGNTGSMPSGVTELKASGVIAITVNAVNDAPVNSVPAAQSTLEDTALTLSTGNTNAISISDVDAGTASVEVILGVTNGTLTLGSTTGLDFGQPGGDMDGSDGTLRFQGSISSINTALDGLTYTPTLDFNGPATLTITTSDLGNSGSGGAKTDTDTVAITVNPDNDRPTATGDSYFVQGTQALVANDTTGTVGDSNNDSVLVNDSDPDGDTLMAVLGVGPSFHSGVFTLNPNGTFTYQHDGSSNVSDSFTYHVTDGLLDSTPPVTVTFAINAVPVITDGSFMIDENSANGTAVGSVSASDANMDPLTFSIVSGNPGGAFRINSSGAISVNNSSLLNFETTPSYSLVVRVNDGNNGTADAVVTVALNDLVEAIVVNPVDFTNNGLTVVRSGSKVRIIDTITRADVLPAHVITSVSSLTLTGRDGLNDRLTVDYSNGNPIPTSGISYAGGAGGSDSLSLVSGSVTNITHSFTSSSSGSVNIDGSVITYTGLEPITDSLLAQTRTFAFGSAADVVTLEDIGTSSDGVSRISSVSTSERVDFSVPGTSIEIVLGSGNDSLTATGLDGNFLGIVTVLGGTGNDTINVSGLTGRTSLVGSDGNDVITGGSGADFILGDLGDDFIRGGDGNDSILAGAGRDTLSGGSGNNEVLGQGTSFDLLRENVTGTVTLTSTDFQTFNLTWGTGNSNLLIRHEFIELTGSSAAEDFDLSGFVHGSRAVTVLAGSGDDIVMGSPQGDVIDGGDGNDILAGEGGNDTISGGAGRDLLQGGDDADTITGGDDADTITGGKGDDAIDGGAGDDAIFAGNGRDEVSGGSGNDRLFGDNGYDTLSGGTGDDYIRGGRGRDLLYGESGNDQLFGDIHDDTLIGGDNDDTLKGNAGEDRIFAGSGNDLVDGGSEDDRLFGDAGNDTINGGDGADFIRGGSGADTILGDAGDDVIDGGQGNDTIRGGFGNDTINGGTGNDLLTGDRGNDGISGFEGDDIIKGGLGNDLLVGHAGADQIFGQAGEDTLVGGGGTSSQPDGTDTLDGGTQADLLDGQPGELINVTDEDTVAAFTSFPSWVDSI